MKLYLAGPDVFRPDAQDWAAQARALCIRFGHQPLLPLDNEESAPVAIYSANIALIRCADAVIANLNPFRGSEPDSGTCVEVGFALALGKPVIGHLQDGRTLAERIAGTPGADRPVDRDGFHVENFGLPLNLMLAVPARIVIGGLEEALACLAAGN